MSKVEVVRNKRTLKTNDIEIEEMFASEFNSIDENGKGYSVAAISFSLMRNTPIKEVFGIRFDSNTDRVDSVRLLAHYDIDRKCVTGSIVAELICTEPKTRYKKGLKAHYRLNAIEKSVLLEKMEEHCQAKIKMSIAEYISKN